MDRNMKIHYERWWEAMDQISTERNWIDHNVDIFLWNMTGDDKYNQDGLE